jgi:hypothetical protein
MTATFGIPHRPVAKEDANFSKIKPVFNCSLKSCKWASLNEAAYPGVDLLSDLSQLIKFRIGSHDLLSDIKLAILQIKLKKEGYRNMFFLRRATCPLQIHLHHV